MKRILTIVTLLASCFAFADDDCNSSPLTILLTNDDGVGAVGIEEMHRALLAAGHRVRRVAPDSNFSGGGASITRTVTVEDLSTEMFPEVYAISGSPASAVIFAATAMPDFAGRFDLVISGINYGPNLGPAVTFSGTVGAVLAGMNAFSVPGIAVSTRPPDKNPKTVKNRRHFANVARFVARSVDAINCSSPSFFDAPQGLIINYPHQSPGDVRGVRLARQGKHLHNRRVAFVEDSKNGSFDIHAVPFETGLDIDLADTRLFEEGYITIVPIDGQYESRSSSAVEPILQLRP